MVFYVAGAAYVFWPRRPALEFMKDCLKGLAHHVGKHVEPAPMCHAEHNLLDAQLATALKDLFHSRN